MTYSLDDPRWLLVALIAIPSAILAIHWFATMAAARRWSAVVLRALLIATLAVILAGLTSVRSTNRLAVVAVLDISQSIRLFADVGNDPQTQRPLDPIDAAWQFLRAASPERGPEDLLGLVVFDGRTIAIATPTAADISPRLATVRDAPAAAGTDIASALRFAASLIPPDAAGRLILLSDGNQTTGDAESAARQLASTSTRLLPIDVVPLTIRAEREVIVESLNVPPRAASQATVTARVTLRATAPARGRLVLTLAGQPLTGDAAPRDLTLDPGTRTELINIRLPEGRVHDLRAVWEPQLDPATGSALGDTRLENNTAEAFAITPGRGSVLIIDPEAAGSNSAGLAAALRASLIGVTVASPESLPASPLELQAFDLLILANVPAELVTDAAQKSIVTAVGELGMGLVMVGGPESFGAGGWKGSLIEPLLPVKLDLPERLVQPDAAVMIVLDNSGSMARPVAGSALSKQEIANQSAALAIRSLDAKDLFGMVVFNNTFNNYIPLAPNTDSKATSQRVLGITAGGGTNAPPALRAALEQIREARAAVKHVILITDGVSQNREELPQIAQTMRDNGITLSTIGVGDEMDEATMAATASAGGGRFFAVTNPALLPRFLLKAVRVVRSPMIRLGDFQPAILATASPLIAGLGTPPQLKGLVLTQPRPEPTITNALAHPQGEPILSHWVYQLGQVAAFTSDASLGADGWAQRWRDWPGYQLFWSTLARTLARPQTSGTFDLSTTVDGDRLRLRLEATGAAREPLDRLSVPAQLFAAGGSSRPVELSLTQTGPGVYEATSPPLAAGNYVATITPRQGDRRLTPVVGGVSIGSNAEFRSLVSNPALLRRIAQDTGGRVLTLNNPADAKPFDRTGLQPSIARTPLLLPLLALAITLLLLDIATRRIAWDRLTSSEFNPRTATTTSDTHRATAAVKSELPTRAPAPTSLGDTDAERIIQEQRARRMRERLDQARAMRAQAADSPPDTSAAEDAGPTSLLEAKRRARQQLDDR